MTLSLAKLTDVRKEKNVNATWFSFSVLNLHHSQLSSCVFFSLFFTSAGIQKWTPSFCFCGLYCRAHDTDTCMQCAAGLSVVRWAPLWELRAPTAACCGSNCGLGPEAVAHSQGFQMKRVKFCVLLHMSWNCCTQLCLETFRWTKTNFLPSLLTLTVCSQRASYSKLAKVVSLVLSCTFFCFQVMEGY